MTWKSQNDLIQMTDQLVIDEVLQHIIPKNEPFSVTIDETTDSSTKMQIAIRIRYTNDENGIPEENLIAMIEAHHQLEKHSLI